MNIGILIEKIGRGERKRKERKKGKRIGRRWERREEKERRMRIGKGRRGRGRINDGI